MLKDIIKAEQEKRNDWHNQQVARHIAHREKMVKLKTIVEDLGEGCIRFNDRFFEPTQENLNRNYLPNLGVANIMGAVNIQNCEFNEQGGVEWISVCGLGIFALMGEKHTIESFFRKIAPYLK